MFRIRTVSLTPEGKYRIIIAEVVAEFVQGTLVNTVIFRYGRNLKKQSGFFHLPDATGALHCFYVGRPYVADLRRRSGGPIRRFNSLKPEGTLYIMGNILARSQQDGGTRIEIGEILDIAKT